MIDWIMGVYSEIEKLREFLSNGLESNELMNIHVPITLPRVASFN